MTQRVVIGGTYEWLLTASINSEAAPNVYALWDLNADSATVTINFTPPSGSSTHASATLLAATGKAKYVNAAGLLTVTGTWLVSWKVVTSSGRILETEQREVPVFASGAAAA